MKAPKEDEDVNRGSSCHRNVTSFKDGCCCSSHSSEAGGVIIAFSSRLHLIEMVS